MGENQKISKENEFIDCVGTVKFKVVFFFFDNKERTSYYAVLLWRSMY